MLIYFMVILAMGFADENDLFNPMNVDETSNRPRLKISLQDVLHAQKDLTYSDNSPLIAIKREPNTSGMEGKTSNQIQHSNKVDQSYPNFNDQMSFDVDYSDLKDNSELLFMKPFDKDNFHQQISNYKEFYKNNEDQMSVTGAYHMNQRHRVSKRHRGSILDKNNANNHQLSDVFLTKAITNITEDSLHGKPLYTRTLASKLTSGSAELHADNSTILYSGSLSNDSLSISTSEKFSPNRNTFNNPSNITPHTLYIKKSFDTSVSPFYDTSYSGVNTCKPLEETCDMQNSNVTFQTNLTGILGSISDSEGSSSELHTSTDLISLYESKAYIPSFQNTGDDQEKVFNSNSNGHLSELSKNKREVEPLSNKINMLNNYKYKNSFLIDRDQNTVKEEGNINLDNKIRPESVLDMNQQIMSHTETVERMEAKLHSADAFDQSSGLNKNKSSNNYLTEYVDKHFDSESRLQNRKRDTSNFMLQADINNVHYVPSFQDTHSSPLFQKILQKKLNTNHSYSEIDDSLKGPFRNKAERDKQKKQKEQELELNLKNLIDVNSKCVFNNHNGDETNAERSASNDFQFGSETEKYSITESAFPSVEIQPCKNRNRVRRHTASNERVIRNNIKIVSSITVTKDVATEKTSDSADTWPLAVQENNQEIQNHYNSEEKHIKDEEQSAKQYLPFEISHENKIESEPQIKKNGNIQAIAKKRKPNRKYFWEELSPKNRYDINVLKQQKEPIETNMTEINRNYMTKDRLIPIKKISKSNLDMQTKDVIMKNLMPKVQESAMKLFSDKDFMANKQYKDNMLRKNNVKLENVPATDELSGTFLFKNDFNSNQASQNSNRYMDLKEESESALKEIHDMEEEEEKEKEGELKRLLNKHVETTPFLIFPPVTLKSDEGGDDNNVRFDITKANLNGIDTQKKISISPNKVLQTKQYDLLKTSIIHHDKGYSKTQDPNESRGHEKEDPAAIYYNIKPKKHHYSHPVYTIESSDKRTEEEEQNEIQDDKERQKSVGNDRATDSENAKENKHKIDSTDGVKGPKNHSDQLKTNKLPQHKLFFMNDVLNDNILSENYRDNGNDQPHTGKNNKEEELFPEIYLKQSKEIDIDKGSPEKLSNKMKSNFKKFQFQALNHTRIKANKNKLPMDDQDNVLLKNKLFKISSPELEDGETIPVKAKSHSDLKQIKVSNSQREIRNTLDDTISKISNDADMKDIRQMIESILPSNNHTDSESIFSSIIPSGILQSQLQGQREHDRFSRDANSKKKNQIMKSRVYTPIENDDDDDSLSNFVMPEKKSSGIQPKQGDTKVHQDTISGDLAHKIVNTILKKERERGELQKHFVFSTGQNKCPDMDKIAKTEDNEKHQRNEEVMKKVMKLLEGLATQEAKSNVCTKLTPELKSFLVWMLEKSDDENTEQVGRDNFLFHQHHGTSAPHKKLKSDVHPFYTSDRYNTLPPDPQEIMKQISVFQNLVQEHESLSKNEKSQVKGLYEHLITNLNALRSMVGMPNYNSTVTKDTSMQNDSAIPKKVSDLKNNLPSSKYKEKDISSTTYSSASKEEITSRTLINSLKFGSNVTDGSKTFVRNFISNVFPVKKEWQTNKLLDNNLNNIGNINDHRRIVETLPNDDEYQRYRYSSPQMVHETQGNILPVKKQNIFNLGNAPLQIVPKNDFHMEPLGNWDLPSDSDHIKYNGDLEQHSRYRRYHGDLDKSNYIQNKQKRHNHQQLVSSQYKKLAAKTNSLHHGKKRHNDNQIKRRHKKRNRKSVRHKKMSKNN